MAEAANFLIKGREKARASSHVRNLRGVIWMGAVLTRVNGFFSVMPKVIASRQMVLASIKV